MTACTEQHARPGTTFLPQLLCTFAGPEPHTGPSTMFTLPGSPVTTAHSITCMALYMPAAVQDGDRAPRSIAAPYCRVALPDTCAAQGCTNILEFSLSAAAKNTGCRAEPLREANWGTAAWFCKAKAMFLDGSR